MPPETKFNVNDLIYDPKNCVTKICDPRTGFPWPICKELFQLYKSDCNEFNKLINEHKENHNLFEKAVIRYILNERLIFSSSPLDIKDHFNEHSQTKTEFYSYIELSSEKKTQYKINGCTFNEFLESLVYLGQGCIDKRGHDNLHEYDSNKGGNQTEIAKELKKNPHIYYRIVNESNIFDLLDKAKESTSIMVYNYSNLWNANRPSILIPPELASLNNLHSLIVSFGIYTLYQNYLNFAAEFCKNDSKISARELKDQNIKRQNEIQLKREESAIMIINRINILKSSLNKSHKTWINDVKIIVSDFEKLNTEKSKKLVDKLNSELLLLEGSNYNNIGYTSLIRHLDFIETTWLKFQKNTNN